MDVVAEWYAVKTKSRHEKKVTETLMQNKIEVYYPTTEVWSKRKDRRKKIQASLFPGYLFVKCILTDDNWYAINNIRGVANMVGVFSRPTPIPGEQIESIHLVLEAGLPVNPHPYLNEGERVEVTAGPLKGARGIYVKPDQEKGKLIVSIDTLGRSIEVDVEPCFVEKD